MEVAMNSVLDGQPNDSSKPPSTGPTIDDGADVKFGPGRS
jgi:hypothetical protein